jgi:hypothetical protein
LPFLCWSFQNHYPSHKSLYLPHVSCLEMFRYVCHVHLHSMSPTFWYRWHQCNHIPLTALQLFLLHQEFSYCTLANKRYWQPHFLHHTAETVINKAHTPLCTNVCNWTMVVTLYDLQYYMKPVNI